MHSVLRVAALAALVVACAKAVPATSPAAPLLVRAGKACIYGTGPCHPGLALEVPGFGIVTEYEIIQVYPASSSGDTMVGVVLFEAAYERLPPEARSDVDLLTCYRPGDKVPIRFTFDQCQRNVRTVVAADGFYNVAGSSCRGPGEGRNAQIIGLAAQEGDGVQQLAEAARSGTPTRVFQQAVFAGAKAAAGATGKRCDWLQMDPKSLTAELLVKSHVTFLKYLPSSERRKYADALVAAGATLMDGKLSVTEGLEMRVELRYANDVPALLHAVSTKASVPTQVGTALAPDPVSPTTPAMAPAQNTSP